MQGRTRIGGARRRYRDDGAGDLVFTMQCLCRRQRLDEAERVSAEVLGNQQWASVQSLRGEALICLGRAQLMRGGDVGEARAVLDEALRVTETLSPESQSRYVAVALSALVAILADGDWMGGARITSPASGRAASAHERTGHRDG